MFGILRTLLAINVVLLHIFSVPKLGNLSVSFFFVLSGFLMTLIMHKTYGYSMKGVVFFWKNRVLRLYPIYLALIIITIISLAFITDITTHPHMFLPNGIIEWISNITMIYPNFIPHRFEPRLVPPSWALTNELIFYLLISLGLSRTKKLTVYWVLISVLYYLFTYLFYNLPTYRYSTIMASSLPFSLGALLFWYKNKIEVKGKLSIVVFTFIAFIINGVIGNYNHIYNEFSIYINIVLALLLIYQLYNLKIINKKWKKIDNYIGQYSYPIYLSHFLVGIYYVKFDGIGSTISSFKIDVYGIFPYLITLFLFCFLIVHLIDKPVNKYKNSLKNKFRIN